MKKCTYCGKEYPEGAEVCAIDGQPLVSDPGRLELPLQIRCANILGKQTTSLTIAK